MEHGSQDKVRHSLERCSTPNIEVTEDGCPTNAHAKESTYRKMGLSPARLKISRSIQINVLSGDTDCDSRTPNITISRALNFPSIILNSPSCDRYPDSGLLDDHSEITSSVSSSSGLGRAFSSVPSITELSSHSLGMTNEVDLEIEEQMIDPTMTMPSKDALPEFLRRRCMDADEVSANRGSEESKGEMQEQEETTTPLASSVAYGAYSRETDNDMHATTPTPSASSYSDNFHQQSTYGPATSYAFTFQPTGRRQDKLQLERDVAPFSRLSSSAQSTSYIAQPTVSASSYRFIQVNPSAPSRTIEASHRYSEATSNTEYVTPQIKSLSSNECERTVQEKGANRVDTTQSDHERQEDGSAVESVEQNDGDKDCPVSGGYVEDATDSSISSSPLNDPPVTPAKSKALPGGSPYSVPTGQCRVCLQEGIITSFIQPCNCRGSSRWVHRECLDAWRKMSQQAYSQCDVCHAKFKFHPRVNRDLSATICGKTIAIKPTSLSLLKDLVIFVVFLAMILAVLKGLVLNFWPSKRIPPFIAYSMPTFTSFSPTGRTIYVACLVYKLARMFKRYILSGGRAREQQQQQQQQQRQQQQPPAQQTRGYMGVFSALFESSNVGMEEVRRGRNEGGAGFQFNHNGVHVRVQGGISPFAGLFFFMGHGVIETIANTLALQGLISFILAVSRFIRLSKSRAAFGDETNSPDWDVVVDLRESKENEERDQSTMQSAS